MYNKVNGKKHHMTLSSISIVKRFIDLHFKNYFKTTDNFPQNTNRVFEIDNRLGTWEQKTITKHKIIY